MLSATSANKGCCVQQAISHHSCPDDGLPTAEAPAAAATVVGVPCGDLGCAGTRHWPDSWGAWQWFHGTPTLASSHSKGSPKSINLKCLVFFNKQLCFDVLTIWSHFQKFLCILAPPLPTRSGPSEPSERLPPGPKSAESPSEPELQVLKWNFSKFPQSGVGGLCEVPTRLDNLLF